MRELLTALRNPLAALDRRWTPSPRTLRIATNAALVMSVVIVVTGGAVRLTGSGLGCDTWPKCTGDSLVTTPEMGIHGVIEFGNRLLTYVLAAAIGWVIVASRCANPRRRSVTRLGWYQVGVVLANAIVGGITVLTGLNPFSVAAHFLLATVLITLTTIARRRAREGDEAPQPLVGQPVRRAVYAVTAVCGALVVVGTAVTGSGRHAGDPGEITRMPFDWETITRLHAALAWMVVLGTIAVIVGMRLMDAPAGPRARARDLLIVLLAQGAVGYVQYALDEPELLVGIHLLGAAVTWVAMIRLVLSLRDRGPVPERPTGNDRAPAAPPARVTGGDGHPPAGSIAPGEEERTPAGV
ncbi:COX15/CtaA family protein [Streptomyces alkaliphilus]|uniref:COX15/CtaA family protein n=1 Tax=Streptomyces alkaliphilus TaxID=1472722 RepID=UPI002B2006C3|nr:COX15/CtaA family protein [Streptomyces alkaliphilus]